MAALNVAAELIVEYSRNGIELRRNGNRGSGARPQGLYRCRGDDEWVAIAALDDAARASLARLVGPRDAGPEEADTLVADWAGRRSAAEAVDALRAGGVAAARVTPAAELLADPQLLARGFWETVEHPVAGTFLCTGMPFAFLGRPRRWIRRVPPLYGQHTAEVLKGVLGRDDDDLAALREAGATSARPAGL